MAEISSLYVSIIDNSNPKLIKLKVHFLIRDENDPSSIVINNNDVKGLIMGHDEVVSFWPQSFNEFNENQLLKLELDIESESIKYDDKPNNRPIIFHRKPTECEHVVQLIEIRNLTINDYINLNSFDITDVVEKHSHTRFQRIYLQNENYLYGPFKFEKYSLIPIKGKEAKKYQYYPELKFKLNETTSVYIGELKNEIALIDCMSTEQIVEYCKDLIQLNSDERQTING